VKAPQEVDLEGMASSARYSQKISKKMDSSSKTKATALSTPKKKEGGTVFSLLWSQNTVNTSIFDHFLSKNHSPMTVLKKNDL